MSKKIDLTGRRFGRLIVESLAYVKQTPSNQTIPYWNCICDCGNRKVIRGTALKTGCTVSCGCFRKEVLHKLKSKDLTGQRFGMLTAIKYIKTDRNRHNVWLCHCDCGNNKEVTSDLLQSGHTQSCGCLGASLGEMYIEKAVKKLGLKYLREIEFDDLVTKAGGKMRFDFGIFDDSNNLISLIEFQGEQHYITTKGSFGELQRTVTDRAKKEYCKNKNIPLFEIKYSDNVEYEILDMLCSLPVFQVNFVPSAADSCEGVTTIRKE